MKTPELFAALGNRGEYAALPHVTLDEVRMIYREGQASGRRRMYPIQRGPSVPYEVMVPHEAWSQRNHGQSIDRIAERGGFSPAEAWAVVNGKHWHEIEEMEGGFESANKLWCDYAERTNLHYSELETQRAVIHKLRLAINEAIAIGGGHSPEEWEASQVGLCQALVEVKVMLGEK